jgi:hypothetical protein
MDWSHVETRGLGLGTSHRTDYARGRMERVSLWLIVAAVLAALTSIYFGVNAGADYPEPWAQMSD